MLSSPWFIVPVVASIVFAIAGMCFLVCYCYSSSQHSKVKASHETFKAAQAEVWKTVRDNQAARNDSDNASLAASPPSNYRVQMATMDARVSALYVELDQIRGSIASLGLDNYRPRSRYGDYETYAPLDWSRRASRSVYQSARMARPPVEAGPPPMDSIELAETPTRPPRAG